MMTVSRSDFLEIRSSDHVVRVRQEVRTRAIEAGLGLVDQTKIVTAASEVARNTIDYGGGGALRLDSVQASLHKGLRLVFSDQGPGIADVAQALTDGFTTGAGLGLGLGGAKRLSNEFDIQSAPGAGTIVTLVRWK